MIKKYGLCVLACLLLSGCWDRVEIENRRFAVAVAVDRAEQEGYTVTLALPALTKENGQETYGGAEIKKASGVTVAEALQALSLQTGKKIYVGQAKMLVLGDALLSDAELFTGAMDALDRHAELDRQIAVLAASGPAYKVLETRPPDETLPGLYVAEYYKDTNKTAGTTFRCDFERLNALLATGRAMIPMIEAGKDTLKLSGAQSVNHNRSVEKFTGEELRGYLWCRSDQCRGARILLENDDVPVTLTVDKQKTRLIFEENNDRLRCTVYVRITGRIDRPYAPEDERDTLSVGFADRITGEIQQAAGKVQLETGADVYGWHDELRKRNYPLYQKYGTDWERAFAEMEIDAAVTVVIRDGGGIR